MIKVSKSKSGGIDLEHENGFVYECGDDWFKTHESSQRYFEHLMEKNWFDNQTLNSVIELVGFKPDAHLRAWHFMYKR